MYPLSTNNALDILRPDNGLLLVITVGNPMRMDDGAGPYISGSVRNPREGIRILDGGSRPEDILEEAIQLNPGRVVFIDIADFNGRAGDVMIIPEEAVDQKTFSTHSIPLTLLSRLITEETRARVDFLGIQPERIDFGEGLSERVKASAEEIIKLLGVNGG